jgi:hypothetical protein
MQTGASLHQRVVRVLKMRNVLTAGVGPGSVLDLERSNATIETNELTQLLYGGPEQVERRRRIAAMVASDPVFSKRNKFFLSREQIIERGMKMAARFVEVVEERKLSQDDAKLFWAIIDEVFSKFAS